MLLEDAVKIYLENLMASVAAEVHRPGTYDNVARIPRLLRNAHPGMNVEDITENTVRDHVTAQAAFHKVNHGKDWSPRTKAYQYMIVKMLLKANGITITNKSRAKSSRAAFGNSCTHWSHCS